MDDKTARTAVVMTTGDTASGDYGASGQVADRHFAASSPWFGMKPS